MLATMAGSILTCATLLALGGPGSADARDVETIVASTAESAPTAVLPTTTSSTIVPTTTPSTTVPTTAPPTTTTTTTPTTTPPSTTTPPTVPPPTTTTAPPPPPPPPSDDPGLVGLERARVALRVSLPPAWVGHIEPPLQEISGYTSLAWYDASFRSLRTDISTGHLTGDWDHLRFVMVHEWAHHVAFAHGSRAFPGAPPNGFPAGNASNVAERWADCAAVAITGHEFIARGHAACQAEQRQFAADWFAANAPG